MSVSILVVDDELDVADLFRQQFRREARQGTCVMHFAASGAEAMDRLAGVSSPHQTAIPHDIGCQKRDEASFNSSAAEDARISVRRSRTESLRDSPLEEDGFELLVRGRGESGCRAPGRSRSRTRLT